MDIGCADGFFTRKISEKGYFTIGIDNSADRVENAKKRHKNKENITFVEKTITPENISNLPSTDIVLLLTVFHHWCGEFGNTQAEEMLRSLAENSEKIIFEPPGTEASNFSKISGERPVDSNMSVEKYYDTLLTEIFPDEVDINYLGETEYNPATTRTDPIYVISCSEYGH